MNTIPDKWCLVRIDDELTKVMATWSGGYLDGDRWKLNSGIKEVKSTEDSFLITGYSGLIYECRKSAYGINTYGAAVLKGAELSPMKECAALRMLKSYNISDGARRSR